MTGKPTIDPKIHARIRKLAKAGHSRPAIQEQLGVSNYTVRKALDPDFLDRERERQRALGPARYAARKDDPDYRARQKAHADTDAYREAARARMAALRKSKSAS